MITWNGQIDEVEPDDVGEHYDIYNVYYGSELMKSCVGYKEFYDYIQSCSNQEGAT